MASYLVPVAALRYDVSIAGKKRGKSKVVKVKGSRTFKQVWAILKAFPENAPVTSTYMSPALQSIHEYFSLLDEKE